MRIHAHPYTYAYTSRLYARVPDVGLVSSCVVRWSGGTGSSRRRTLGEASSLSSQTRDKCGWCVSPEHARTHTPEEDGGWGGKWEATRASKRATAPLVGARAYAVSVGTRMRTRFECSVGTMRGAMRQYGVFVVVVSFHAKSR